MKPYGLKKKDRVVCGFGKGKGSKRRCTICQEGGSHHSPTGSSNFNTINRRLKKHARTLGKNSLQEQNIVI